MNMLTRPFRISDLVLRISFACLVALAGSQCVAACDVPLVEEEVDAIACVRVAGGASRVLFFRAGRLLADRLFVDEMEWHVRPAARHPFELHWHDHGSCDRIVRSRELTSLYVSRDPLLGDDGAWWQQNRRMTDLKAP